MGVSAMDARYQLDDAALEVAGLRCHIAQDQADKISQRVRRHICSLQPCRHRPRQTVWLCGFADAQLQAAGCVEGRLGDDVNEPKPRIIWRARLVLGLWKTTACPTLGRRRSALRCLIFGSHGRVSSGFACPAKRPEKRRLVASSRCFGAK